MFPFVFGIGAPLLLDGESTARTHMRPPRFYGRRSATGPGMWNRCLPSAARGATRRLRRMWYFAIFRRQAARASAAGHRGTPTTKDGAP